MVDDSNVGIYLRSQGIPAGGETPGAGIFMSPQGGLDMPSFSNWFQNLQPVDQGMISAAIANMGAPGPGAAADPAATDPAAAAQASLPNAGQFSSTDNLPGVPGSTTNVGTPAAAAAGMGNTPATPLQAAETFTGAPATNPPVTPEGATAAVPPAGIPQLTAQNTGPFFVQSGTGSVGM